MSFLLRFHTRFFSQQYTIKYLPNQCIVTYIVTSSIVLSEIALACAKVVSHSVKIWKYADVNQVLIHFQPWNTFASKINGTPKGVYLPISKLHSILAVANLLAHNKISQICYCGQISLQNAAFNCSFSNNLTPLGVTFILLVMVPFLNFKIHFLKNFKVKNDLDSFTIDNSGRSLATHMITDAYRYSYLRQNIFSWQGWLTRIIW